MSTQYHGGVPRLVAKNLEFSQRFGLVKRPVFDGRADLRNRRDPDGGDPQDIPQCEQMRGLKRPDPEAASSEFVALTAVILNSV